MRWRAQHRGPARQTNDRLQRGHRTNAVESPLAIGLREHSHRASTGPPHECGGEPEFAVSMIRLVPCFNGATARMRWRAGDRRRDAVRTSPRFNGATARGRRRARSSSLTPPQMRQESSFNGAGARGRRRVSSKSMRRLPGHRASTGPPHECGGEPPADVELTRVYAALQRGHRTNAVESVLTRLGPAQRRTGFNGATARMRWRVTGRGAHRARSTALQRGHRTNAVERSDFRECPPERVSASTGPPHECGGERHESCATSDAVGRLQRGHPRMRWRESRLVRRVQCAHELQRGHRTNAVESHGELRRHCSRQCFNGATARMRWRVAA